MTATMTAEGQVTVPKDVRDRLGLQPGSQIDFVLAEDGRVFIACADRPVLEQDAFVRWRGALRGGLSTDEIMALTRGDDLA